MIVSPRQLKTRSSARGAGRGALRCLVMITLAVLAACSSPAGSHTSAQVSPSVARPAHAGTGRVIDPATPTAAATSGAASTGAAPTTAGNPDGRKPVLTSQGMWWGVDSTAPINGAALANVRDWYRGRPHPQFWGRYLGGSYAVDGHELAFARSHHIYVYLIVPDDNCSGCSGGDSCGNDMSAAQARTDAEHAAAEARKLHLPRGTALYKDIEEVSACHDEPSASYLIAWDHTLDGTGYRTGFYGNVHKQFFEFPRAYCSAVKSSAAFPGKIVLAMNEDEPRIGAPQGSTGPHNAPEFTPKSPSCAPDRTTTIWQYGESLDSGNWTDIDEARPDTPGLLAPDGSVTG